MPDSVIWFEPPIVCRWETNFETLESNLTDGAKPPLGNAANTTATPTEATPLSTTTNASPLKGSPRFPAKLRKRSSQKSTVETECLTRVGAVREVTDFDLFNIPCGIDIYDLFQDFVVPRLPPGFCLRWEKSTPVLSSKVMARQQRKQKKRRQREGIGQRLIMLARHQSVNRADEAASGSQALASTSCGSKSTLPVREEYITNEFLDWDEPRELFPEVEIKKLIKFKEKTKDKHSYILKSKEAKQNQVANGGYQDKLQKYANTKNDVETKRVSLNGVCARKDTASDNRNGKANGHRNNSSGNEPALSTTKNGDGHANGHGGAISDSSSRRSSKETTESAPQEMEALARRKTYMFSKLLEVSLLFGLQLRIMYVRFVNFLITVSFFSISLLQKRISK